MSGRTFYIDHSAGKDSNDGLSPSKPLRDYSACDCVGGDTVLFKRGSVIRDVLHARCGVEGAPIIYGAYGEGPKPAFLGSVDIGDQNAWVEETPAIWRYTGSLPSEVCNLVFNDGQSCGVLAWRRDDVSKPGRWFYSAIGNRSAPENGREELRDGVLYLYSPVNPGLAYSSIECVLWGERRLVDGRSHLVIENLCFKNSGVHGFQDANVHDVILRNCDFRFIGGAVWSLEHRIRFGNAVEFWDGGHDISVEGCLFDNIYDAAVTHQGGTTRNIPYRIGFRNNLFVDCGLAAYECREPSREIYFEYNTCINGSGGFSVQDEIPPRNTNPYPKPIGYHVFIWLIDACTQPGNVYIRNNVFCDGYGLAISAVIEPKDEKYFVIDQNAYWQSNADTPLFHFARFSDGKDCQQALDSIISKGVLPLVSEGLYRGSDFARYQTERNHDQHSLVVEPRFVDPSHGDFRQRADSPCRDWGCQADVRR
ncbi:MAG: hypothetical protein PHR35_19480 [Kiritimatiellae bacterium]|nr:hypothetical protein [Kiritimatiellia bacterium]